MVGLITNVDETAYREQVRENIFLNVGKIIMDYRKQRAEYTPIHIEGPVVERVESFKFHCVHIAKDLSWSKHTSRVMKRALQWLFPLKGLKRFGIGPQIFKSSTAAPLRAS